jgi:cell division protein FtsB
MAYQLTNKKKSWFHSSWVAIGLIILVVLGVISVVHAFAKERVAIKLRDDEESQLQELNAKQADLSQKIQDFSTPRGIEGQIRDQYRVVKPGEQLVILVNNGNAVPPQPKPTFWQSVMKFIGF